MNQLMKVTATAQTAITKYLEVLTLFSILAVGL
jgi:hypothetical protein